MSAAAARKIAIDLDLHLAIESVYNESCLGIPLSLVLRVAVP